MIFNFLIFLYKKLKNIYNQTSYEIKIMINRDKISPLMVIGICILIPSTIGTILFTLRAPYCSGFFAVICFYSVIFAPFGIFAGGVLLFLGIFFSLKGKKSKKS
jgi:hypothetical protein